MFREILNTLSQNTLTQLDLIKHVTHPGESGRARENVIRNFLQSICPPDLGLSTGFVVDANGQKSKQIDIVIYRQEYYPILDVGGIKHFMAESVLAVMENKASVDSERDLSKALENIKSVKQLDRTNKGKNYLVVGNERAPRNLDVNNFTNQVFGAIVTEKSLAQATFNGVMRSFFGANEKLWWPNIYVDVRSFIATYGLKDSSGAMTVTTDLNKANYFGRGNQSYPLSDFAYELVNYLRVASKIDFTPSSYLSPLPYAPFEFWDLVAPGPEDSEKGIQGSS